MHVGEGWGFSGLRGAVTPSGLLLALVGVAGVTAMAGISAAAVDASPRDAIPGDARRDRKQ